MLLKIFFTVMKWFLCFPKSQSKIKPGSVRFKFTLTFWRNENWNDLVKIISWCIHLAWIHCRDIIMWIGYKQGCMCCLYIAEWYPCDDGMSLFIHLVCTVWIHDYKVNDLLESWFINHCNRHKIFVKPLEWLFESSYTFADSYSKIAETCTEWL